MSKPSSTEENPRCLREIVQKKFLEEVIGCAGNFLYLLCQYHNNVKCLIL